jgi:hypothetical protein
VVIAGEEGRALGVFCHLLGVQAISTIADPDRFLRSMIMNRKKGRRLLICEEFAGLGTASFKLMHVSWATASPYQSISAGAQPCYCHFDIQYKSKPLEHETA